MLQSILIKIKALKIKRTESRQEFELLFESLVRSDELFAKLIQYTYDTTKKYKIRKIPKLETFTKKYRISEERRIEKAFLFLEYFSQHEKIQHKYKNAFFELVNQIPYGYEVFNAVLKRTFNLYLGNGHIIKNLIGYSDSYPSLFYMHQLKLQFLNYPVYGFDYYNYQYTRLFAIVKNKKVSFLTSKMRPITLYDNTYKQTFLKACNKQDKVFVCQALLKVNKYTNKRKKTKSQDKYYAGIVLRQLFQKQNFNKDSAYEMNNIELHVEAILEYDEFYKYQSLQNTKQMLNSDIWVNFPNNDKVSTMKYQIFHNIKELMIHVFNNPDLSILAKWYNYRWKTGRSNQSLLLTKVNKCVLNVKKIEYKNNKKICHCYDKSEMIYTQIDKYLDTKLKNSIPDDYTQQVLVYYCNVLRKTKNDEGIIKTRLSYPIIIAKSERLPTHYCDIINKNKVIKENLWNQNKKLMKPVKSYHHVKLAGIIETSQDK